MPRDQIADLPKPRPPSRGGNAGDGTRHLLRSLLFLLVLCGLGVRFYQPLANGFAANPLLNGTILGIFAFGVLYTLKGMVEVMREARAAGRAATLVREARRTGRPQQQVDEVLAALTPRSVAAFLGTVSRVVQGGDTAATLPYLLDSLATRSEDRRALVRYLTGALVLLGLIGTFYGLLVTIGGVREVLDGLATGPDADTVALLTGLKDRLGVPLGGMGTAFSSSLFGLLSSLLLAFLELQLFHAQNDVHARLESLVVSDLVPFWQTTRGRAVAASEGTGSPDYVTALLEATAERLDHIVRQLENSAGRDLGQERLAEKTAQLGEHIDSLRDTLSGLERDRTADLRHELRLLTRSLHQAATPEHAPEA